MNSAYSILLVPVIGLALIVTFARGNCAMVVGRLVARFCQGAWNGLLRLLIIRIQQDRHWFLVGVLAGVAFDVLCTLTSRSRGGDLESIGFPFRFRTAGGYAYTVYYWWPALLTDIFVLVLLALVGGYAVIGLRRVLHESRDKDLGKPNHAGPSNPARAS